MQRDDTRNRCTIGSYKTNCCENFPFKGIEVCEQLLFLVFWIFLYACRHPLWQCYPLQWSGDIRLPGCPVSLISHCSAVMIFPSYLFLIAFNDKDRECTISHWLYCKTLKYPRIGLFCEAVIGLPGSLHRWITFMRVDIVHVDIRTWLHD